MSIKYPKQGTVFTHKGAVLVIVLFFIVLLAGMVVAFFSRAVFDRQISNNSANTTTTDTFARGAINSILGDFKQEIAAGSTLLTVTGTSTTIVYAPLAASGGNQTAVPYRMAISGTLANLVKQSEYNQPFYSGAWYNSTQYPIPSRAANVSTTAPALNRRFVSLARWNKPLLLPKATPDSSSDQMPVSAFTAPDWILVSKSGSNPLAPGTEVIGRYAYTVYDEGGLLDINVAGYPGSMPTRFTGYKNALSFADLTKIGLTQEQTDALVGWRNYALLQPAGTFPSFTIPASSGSSYYSAAQANSFLKVGSAALLNGQSDRMFCSRQELLRFISGMGSSADQAALQNAMQYVGTFSRDLNQPSYVPAHIVDATAPKVVSGDGGNLAYGGDAVINPAFLTVRATASTVRNDGSKAVAGEPLVNKRFALSRLAWLTCKGPSAKVTGEPVFQETIKVLGWETSKATAWLEQGTDDAVLRYFGLTWDATKGRWNYAAHLTSKHISTLSDVAAANREPDFIELLKAAVSVGSLGKGATRYKASPSAPMPNAGGVPDAQAWEDYQFRQDISVDAHVLQIAANIIDQYDVDGFPTRIYFNDGTVVGTREMVGVENLPYFYRIRSSIVRAIAPNPAGTSGASGNVPGAVLYYGGPDPVPSGYSRLTETGLMVYMMQPELWNPHDQNSQRATLSTLAPADFRFVADSTSPDQIGIESSYATASVCTTTLADYEPFHAVRPDDSGSLNAVIPFDSYPLYPISFTADNTEMDFNISGTISPLFAEPTLLIRPGIPTGSNLKLGDNHSIRKFSSPPLNSTFVKLTQAVASGSGEGIKSIFDNNTYIGMYMAVGPLRWVAKSSGTSYVVSSRLMGSYSNGMWSANWDSGITFRVQCKDPFGNWVTYDQKCSQLGHTFYSIMCNKNSDGSANWRQSRGLIGEVEWASCIDPRASRFGMQSGNNGGAAAYSCPPPGYNGSSPAALNITQGVTYSNRWDDGVGAYLVNKSGAAVGAFDYAYGLPGVGGWYPKTAGHYWTAGTPFCFGLYAQNSTDNAITPQYYADADGVVRRGMSALMSGTVGQPLAIATRSTGTPTLQSQSRPIILNRPFRSVAELGYVFSGTPWKNLDMFTPESGFASLLDVFCVDNDATFVAGKVNLNTRQTAVLTAILSGAYRDELESYGTPPAGTLSALNAAEAEATAQALVNRTTSGEVDKGPLRNLSDLVGRWTGAITDTNGAIDGRFSYHGFSEDLNITVAAASSISRMREASMRALAGCGTTRVWNLMIDVIAQTGHYPPGVNHLAQFNIEGERRYWVHVAIDRYTGEIIDQNMELVRE